MPAGARKSSAKFSDLKARVQQFAGISAHQRRRCQRSEELCGGPGPFSTVNFRACLASVPQDKWNALSEQILAAVNASGEVLLSHTKLTDRYVIHLAIGNVRTEETHIARAWELLQAQCRRLTA